MYIKPFGARSTKMKKLNKVQEARIADYFKDEEYIDQRYYDFISRIIEEDGYIDETLVSEYESRVLG